MLRSENEIVFPFEKCIIFTVVPFVDYLSHLGRGLYNVVYNLCPIPLSFCNKICLIYKKTFADKYQKHIKLFGLYNLIYSS